MNISAIIDEALDACKALDAETSVRVSNREVMEWLRKHRPDIAQHDPQMANEHWVKLIGDRRKARAPRLEEKRTEQILLDFGLPYMPLDTELSIPRDPANPLGAVYWKEIEDATLAEVALHISLLRAQGTACFEKADNWSMLFTRGKRYAKDNLEKTLRELRFIARGFAA